MKAKDTLLLNKTTTQNPILARRAWFWHVASHIIIVSANRCVMNAKKAVGVWAYIGLMWESDLLCHVILIMSRRGKT